jgi:peptidoglycan/xylan/chitin deacetylase (PgdA/CDA1 family)
MLRRAIKYGFFPLVALVAAGIVGVKLAALSVFPTWDRWVSIGLLAFSALAIGKLLAKNIRLRVAEYIHRRRGELQVVSPLGGDSVLSLPSMILIGVVLPLVVFGGLGAGAYAIKQRVQASVASGCVRTQPSLPPVPNDISNSSFGANAFNQPRAWQHVSLGENDAAFSYLPRGYQGNPAVSVSIQHYIDGSAFWFYPPTSAQAGNTYQYSDWYQSNKPSSLIMKYLIKGKVYYQKIDDSVPAAPEWRHYSKSFDIPDGGDTDIIPVSIMHALTTTGTLTIGHVLLHPEMASFMRPLISFTFDDGWKSQYTNGLSLLCKYKVPATFYLISDYLQGYPDYMNVNQTSDLLRKGEEIGGHTVDHRDLASLDPTIVTWELSVSQKQLRNQFDQKIDNFASPYGSVNDRVLEQIRRYYTSHRSTDEGLNEPTDFDPYNIQCFTYTKDMTVAQMEHLVDQAIKTKTWLVFAFHQIDGSTSPYAAEPQVLAQILQYVNNHKSILPMTIEQALTEVRQQV